MHPRVNGYSRLVQGSLSAVVTWWIEDKDTKEFPLGVVAFVIAELASILISGASNLVPRHSE